MEIFIGILIPFIGTMLGALTVYFFNDTLSKKLENVILGFAAGIMVSASVWSLIIPAIEQSKRVIWFPASCGLILGIGIFFALDSILRKRKNSGKVDNLMLAISIHNIPEGMAVGIAFASFLNGGLSLISCYALSLGIAIQNFPEGSIVSLPLRKKGWSKTKAFLYGILSAIFELIGALVTLLFTNLVSILLPYLLTIAAGAMIYVVVVELIPESKSENNVNVIGFILGFIIMMILDIML